MKLKELQTNSEDQSPLQPDEKRQARERLFGTIEARVMHALGRPPDLRVVHVRHLWLDRFRVNVILGPDASAVRVGHSYYLTVGEDGGILSASPKITRVY
jgi:hypothetical protein